MVTGHDDDRIYRVAGRLVKTPTTIAGDFPYGGTALGVVGSVRLNLRTHYEELPDLERGGVLEIVECHHRVSLTCMLREWNNTALSTVFPITTGSGSLKRPLYPSTIRPGRRLGGSAFKLLWVANDVTLHPSILIYNAIPKLAMEVEPPLSAYGELAWAVEFVGARDATNRLYDIGLLSDLTL